MLVALCYQNVDTSKVRLLRVIRQGVSSPAVVLVYKLLHQNLIISNLITSLISALLKLNQKTSATHQNLCKS